MPDPITANELEQRGWTYDPSTGKCEAKWTITVPQRDHIIACLRTVESMNGNIPKAEEVVNENEADAR